MTAPPVRTGLPFRGRRSGRRAVLAGLGVLALGGCFRPMLAESSAGRAMRHRIALPDVEGRFGYHLVRSLEDRLGTPEDPDFRLAVEPELTQHGLAVDDDEAVTRITVLAKADWLLWRLGADEPLIRETAFSEAGYNATGSLFATRVLRRDIEERLARDLGERIARAILARADELAA